MNIVDNNDKLAKNVENLNKEMIKKDQEIQKLGQEYQMQKIKGSGIAGFFDGIIMTTEYKFNLDINYENGIFIDDDPRDLEGLVEKKAIRVIRIRKESNWRSKIDIDNPKVEEYKDFGDIKIEE